MLGWDCAPAIWDTHARTGLETDDSVSMATEDIRVPATGSVSRPANGLYRPATDRSATARDSQPAARPRAAAANQGTLACSDGTPRSTPPPVPPPRQITRSDSPAPARLPQLLAPSPDQRSSRHSCTDCTPRSFSTRPRIWSAPISRMLIPSGSSKNPSTRPSGSKMLKSVPAVSSPGASYS